MAERNIKVKLTAEVGEYILAWDQVKKALENLPDINVKAERAEDEESQD